MPHCPIYMTHPVDFRTSPRLSNASALTTLPVGQGLMLPVMAWYGNRVMLIYDDMLGSRSFTRRDLKDGL